MSDRDRYDDLVGRFREILNVQSPQTGRCCLKLHGPDGVPDCCWTVAMNVSCLEFTSWEIELLWPSRRVEPWKFTSGEGFDLIRHGERWYSLPTSAPEMEASMHTGTLAETIECAAHPTRPIVYRGTVMGVASVNGCVAAWNLPLLMDRKDCLTRLWTEAVDLLGEKAYYDRRGGLVTL